MKILCRQEWNPCLKKEYSQMELWIQEKIWLKKQMRPIFMRNRQWVFWQIQQEIR